MTDVQSIRFGRAICNDLVQAERREWWLSNGCGGYAAGTIAGTLTRRYHGLLVAALDKPVGRRMRFSKADATAVVDGHAFALYGNRWGSGAIVPEGYANIEQFELDNGTPAWRYRLGAALIEHRIEMPHGTDSVRLSWRLIAGESAELRVRLLATDRDHHGGAIAGDPHVDVIDDTRLDISFGNREPLRFEAMNGKFVPVGEWVRDVLLPVERARGLDDREDLFCAAEATFILDHGATAIILASCGGTTEGQPSIDPVAVAQAAHDEYTTAPHWIRELIRAADAFIFERPIGDARGRSVIAGFPWFGDWGRDTMIALPGLTLATGRREAALDILRTFLAHVDGGMLPNYFPGAGAAAEYNTVDAALWYVEAWRAYVAHSGDVAALAEAFPVLASIIAHHVSGTRYGIGCDPVDGLLHAGEPGVQLTWMDAKVGDWVVTPRIGKPVEINALWFNALCAMADFAAMLGKDGSTWRKLADRVENAFIRFAGGDGGGLKDVIDGIDGDDVTLRPNQIFAVSLTHSPLEPSLQQAALAAVRDALLTSYGLRSLVPGHPGYRSTYRGGVLERDGSYHQGTVWPWLLGPYALAEYRVTGDVRLAQSRLDPISDHLLDAGLGTISEIMDADPPHEPQGCPAQAWSVACILDAWLTLEKLKGDMK